MRRTNQNVILSHGGKHGTQSRTLLKGQVVPAAAAVHVPDAAMDARPKNPGTQEVPADSTKRPAATVQTSAKAAHAAPKAEPVVVKAAEAAPPAFAPPSRAREENPGEWLAEAAALGASRAPEKPPEAPTSVVEEAQDPLAPAPPSEPAEASADEGAAEEPERVTVPTSKRQLKRMSKANSYKLAQDLALRVPSNPEDITVKDLHRKLSAELGL